MSKKLLSFAAFVVFLWWLLKKGQAERGQFGWEGCRGADFCDGVTTRSLRAGSFSALD